MKSVLTYIDDCFDDIEKNIWEFCKNKNAEALHQYRVAIKKLKALYKFLAYHDKDFDYDRQFKVHQKLFRLSGNIRDREMILETARKQDIDVLHTTSVTSAQKTVKVELRFCQQAPPYIEKLSRKNAKSFAGSVQKKELRKYFLKGEKKIMRELNGVPPEKHLHIARKKLKQLLYLSKLDKKFPAELSSVIKNLEKKIGEWHDKQILKETIRSFSSKSLLKKLNTAQQEDKKKIIQYKKRFFHLISK